MVLDASSAVKPKPKAAPKKASATKKRASTFNDEEEEDEPKKKVVKKAVRILFLVSVSIADSFRVEGR